RPLQALEHHFRLSGQLHSSAIPALAFRRGKTRQTARQRPREAPSFGGMTTCGHSSGAWEGLKPATHRFWGAIPEDTWKHSRLSGRFSRGRQKSEDFVERKHPEV